VSAYPVVEASGFVWLFFGDLPEDLRPPLPCSFVPELGDPKWHAVYGEIEFDCGHWGVFENAIDMAHIHYLHRWACAGAAREARRAWEVGA
jgi:phenylpropionate dioxygenase-like ring-hydroxylating dioxygenase large terminal subunit